MSDAPDGGIEAVAEGSAEPVGPSLREMAAKYGFAPEVASIDRRLAEARQSSPTIVVVGELNRGKSSLVNALLGGGSLAPVGSGETTALPISFVRGFPGQPGEAWVEFEMPAAGTGGVLGEVVPISLDDLPAWVTVDGPRLAESLERMPYQAFVVADAGLPAGATIVDTPGAGGLVEAHAVRAIARSEAASLLLVVTDAGGRLTSAALAFIERCTAFVESVVVVINKIDTTRTWSAIADENRQILAEAIPRLANAPIVGVSALRAGQAFDESSDERRQRLLDQSRLSDLRDALSSELEDTARVAEANAVRQLISVVSPVLESRQIERDLVAGSSDAEQELLRRRRQHRSLSSVKHNWTYDWEAQVGYLKQEVGDHIEKSVSALMHRWRRTLGEHSVGFKPAEAIELNARFLADVELLYAETAADVVNQSLEVLNALFATAGWKPSAELLEIVVNAPKAEWQDAARPSPDGSGPLPVLKDVNLMLNMVRPAFYLAPLGGAALTATSTTTVVGGALATLAFAGGIVPVAIIGGLLIHKRKAEKDKLSADIAAAEKALTKALDKIVSRALHTIRTEAKRDFSERLTRSLDEIKRLTTAADLAKRQSDENRRARLAVLDREIAELSGIIESAGATYRGA